MDITVIGYGSLMSGHGLSLSGPLQVRQAHVVALIGFRRGFAKLSRYGDRFAMDLSITQFPLRAQAMPPVSPPNGEIEALALTVSLDDACRLAKREGYSPTALHQLAEAALGKGLDLADFLWELHAEANHDVVQYRRRLFALTGFTSAHYILHPVTLDGGGRALIFLAPGFEGTGSDEVISVRQQTGVQAIMNTREVWQRKPTEDQMSYFLSCLLGGIHGICMWDLLSSVGEEPTLSATLTSRLLSLLQEERARFLTATGLSEESYQQSFGNPEAALARSGLGSFLHGGAK
jgi:hypothetical protein